MSREMPDLIDRAWVLKNLMFDVDRDAVRKAPAVDAVEVVRCKECKWYDSVFFGCTKSRFFPDPDFFCACGEKMDGGETHAED